MVLLHILALAVTSSLRLARVRPKYFCTSLPPAEIIYLFELCRSLLGEDDQLPDASPSALHHTLVIGRPIELFYHR